MRWFVAVLDGMVRQVGASAHVRFDSGSQFMANAGQRLVPIQQCRFALRLHRIALPKRLDRIAEKHRPAINKQASPPEGQLVVALSLNGACA